MWPNELALFIVELFNLTSDEAKGVAVLMSFVPYALVICAVVAIPCIMAERRDVKR